MRTPFELVKANRQLRHDHRGLIATREFIADNLRHCMISTHICIAESHCRLPIVKCLSALDINGDFRPCPKLG